MHPSRYRKGRKLTVQMSHNEYPAAPPWVGKQEAETAELGPLPFGGTVPPYGSPENKHGGLLVRFPHAMAGDVRPPGPSWRPVVGWTFFLSVLGVGSAIRRSGQARVYGRSPAAYWVAFLAALLGGAAFWWVLIAEVALPIYQNAREDRATAAVQEKVLSDGRVEAAVGTTVKTGGCVPVGDRGADGLRPYDCTFQLADGRSAAIHIEADTDGVWKTVA
ncbi:hypothetical protein Areg01_59770 [Actinoplanes regularis]|nr:hypothetical protein Areg01_59770 [Actinoplanes regularis]